MKTNNPFPYSDDHKRYHTWNYYLRHTYHTKAFKVALDGGFTCPNRDGLLGYGGCTYCSAAGSGDFAQSRSQDLLTQFRLGKEKMAQKWQGLAIPYFQAFTNTYAPLAQLKERFLPFLYMEDVPCICIATRADCLSQDTIHFLTQWAQKKDIWIELGLQSIHDESAKRIHRGHTYAQFLTCIEQLQGTGIHICVHLINGFPWESKMHMLKSAAALAKLPIHAVKLHMLHVLRGSSMANEYSSSPFVLLDLDQYVEIVIEQLELLPPTMIIQRLSGDGAKQDLIVPKWTADKKKVLNTIDRTMKTRNTWQGRCYQK
ncbi:MAG: TIGR01212 family radical SAM protein [Erysipelotrichaceae bacterium]|nr:TIGR01212 family radical SAM protein [Erysipelotrichaceae bacterium]